MVDKLLYRQIHPDFVVDKKATLRAFKPTKGNPDISVHDGSMIDARPAWEPYTETLGLKSAGVMAVTDTECESQDLTVTSNPKPSFGEHMLISFDGLSKSAIKDAVRSLTADANERKWCYNPADGGPSGHLSN